MTRQTPDSFDDNSNDWTQGGINDDISDLANVYGWESWADIIAPYPERDEQGIIINGGFDETNIRPRPYETPQQALRFAVSGGIDSFSRIMYDVSTGYWHIVVEY